MTTVLGYVVGFACCGTGGIDRPGGIPSTDRVAHPWRQTGGHVCFGSLTGGFAAVWTGDGILRFFHLKANWSFLVVLLVVFLVIEAEHASARRLSLPIAIAAQVWRVCPRVGSPCRNKTW